VLEVLIDLRTLTDIILINKAKMPGSILPLHKPSPPPVSGEPKHGKHEHHRHGHHVHGLHVPGLNHKKPRKNPMSQWITNKWRNELVASLAEFAGTFMFLFFAFGGTQVANTAALYADATTAGQQQNSLTQAPNTSVLLYISLIFGFSLMVTVWVFFRVSGGLFNPAVGNSVNSHGTERQRLSY
jgi:aquaporin related protein